MDDFLSSGSSKPAVKLSEVGDIVTGIVREISKIEDKDLSGELRRWPSGDPKHVYVFTLDVAGEEQSLWVRGQMVTAIREAASAANVSSLVGCKITVKHTALGEIKQKGYNAPKLYKAKVEPQTSVDVDELI
jgi:hypothetical protein